MLQAAMTNVPVACLLLLRISENFLDNILHSYEHKTPPHKINRKLIYCHLLYNYAYTPVPDIFRVCVRARYRQP